MSDEPTIKTRACTNLLFLKDNNAQGFTIIEMLLAITLSAVVMVAVLGQLGSIRRPAQMPAPTHSPSESRFLSLIEQDLEKTISFQASDGVLTLYTYRALAPDTMAETHRPMTVSYRIVEHAGEHWLVRDQKHFDAERDGQGDWVLRTPLRSDVAKARWHALDNIDSSRLANDPSSASAADPVLGLDSNHTDPAAIISQAMLPRFIQVDLFSAADESEPTQTFRLASGNLLARAEQSPSELGGDR